MPLSNEFSNTRLSYLKEAIKNTNNVAQQFYPRYVREYNEQFPFTEQKLSNINNPSNNNSVVKGYLNPNYKEFEDDLILKLTSLTNDESLSRYIFDSLSDSLSPAQIRYYNDNFNTIQKKVRIPYGGLSKENFVEQVLMALSNDTHKNDVSIFDNSSSNNQLLTFPSQQLPLRKDSMFNSSLLSTTSASPKKNTTTTISTRKKAGRPKGSKNKPKVYATKVNDDSSIDENQPIQDVYPNNRGYYSDGNKKKSSGKGIILPPLKFQERVIKHKKVFNNKYAIDTKKLKKHILDLKYLKNANHVLTFQPIEISTYLKNIIENIIKDNYNLNKEEFIHLNDTEKRILKRLFKFLKIKNDDVLEYSNDLTKQFEMAYGSFLAGNTNKELKQELKEYINLALHENTINKSDGKLILKKLNM